MVVVNVMIVCTVYCVFGYMFIHSFIRLFLQPLGVLLGVAPDLILVQASPLISPPGGGAYVAGLQVSGRAYVAELQVSRSVWLGVGEELRGSSISVCLLLCVSALICRSDCHVSIEEYCFVAGTDRAMVAAVAGLKDRSL